MILLELKRRGERGTSVIEVIVDSESGVKLDEITELSRWTGALLDEAEESIPGRYRLEVSSAGLDRPLEHRWQYSKNIGRLLKLTYDDETGNRATGLFELVDLDGDMLILQPRNAKGKSTPLPTSVRLEHVVRAVVEPQF